MGWPSRKGHGSLGGILGASTARGEKPPLGQQPGPEIAPGARNNPQLLPAPCPRGPELSALPQLPVPRGGSSPSWLPSRTARPHGVPSWSSTGPRFLSLSCGLTQAGSLSRRENMEGKSSAAFPSYLGSDLATPCSRSPSHALADAGGKPSGFLFLAAAASFPLSPAAGG